MQDVAVKVFSEQEYSLELLEDFKKEVCLELARFVYVDRAGIDYIGKGCSAFKVKHGVTRVKNKLNKETLYIHSSYHIFTHILTFTLLLTFVVFFSERLL